MAISGASAEGHAPAKASLRFGISFGPTLALLAWFGPRSRAGGAEPRGPAERGEVRLSIDLFRARLGGQRSVATTPPKVDLLDRHSHRQPSCGSGQSDAGLPFISKTLLSAPAWQSQASAQSGLRP